VVYYSPRVSIEPILLCKSWKVFKKYLDVYIYISNFADFFISKLVIFMLIYINRLINYEYYKC